MRIVALSEILPGDPVGNDELAARFGLHERWLDAMTGNRSRYYCRPDGPAGAPQGTGDLAVAAAQRALDKGRVDPGVMDFVVLATASPDELMPATVNRVVDRLGINAVPALQLTSGCAGALQALYVARSLLAAGLTRGLVIGADTCRSLWPSARSVSQMHPAEIINFAMFGDGGGAAVVDARTDGPGLVVEHLFVRTAGRGREPGQIVRWYGADGAPEVPDGRGGTTREPMGEEDYKAIERHVPEETAAILNELTTITGWPLADIEHVLLPQLNGVMTDRIRQRVGVREDQAVSCVAETGNNGNALPLIQLARAVERIESGTGSADRVLGCAVESSKWVLTGMALRHQREGGPR
jgi:3-oxoacyl-[acyl-carrier-protein] synthase-3